MTAPVPRLPPALAEPSPGDERGNTMLVEGIPFQFNPGDEPRIRDLILAEKLGYGRPRAIRDLIKRLVREKKLNDSALCRIVRREDGGVAGRGVEEYWLTEDQALKVALKSQTSQADALLDEVIHVFTLARKQAIFLSSGQSTAQLSLEERRFKVEILDRTLTRLRELGRLNDDVYAAHLATMAELATGQQFPALKPVTADTWRTPTDIAAELGVSAVRVGRLITKLGLRGNIAGLSRAVLNKARGAEKTVTSYQYSPEAVERIRAALGQEQKELLP